MTNQLSLFAEPKTHGPIELNNNQLIVLDYVKECAGTQGHVLNSVKRVVDLSHFPNRRFSTDQSVNVANAYQTLSRKEQAEILQVYSTWILQEGVTDETLLL